MTTGRITTKPARRLSRKGTRATYASLDTSSNPSAAACRPVRVCLSPASFQWDRTMSTIIRLIFAVAALIALVPVALGQQNINAVEIAQLPRFCWAQLNVPDAVGDDFRIRDCGPAANHFCS